MPPSHVYSAVPDGAEKRLIDAKIKNLYGNIDMHDDAYLRILIQLPSQNKNTVNSSAMPLSVCRWSSAGSTIGALEARGGGKHGQ